MQATEQLTIINRRLAGQPGGLPTGFAVHPVLEYSSSKRADTRKLLVSNTVVCRQQCADRFITQPCLGGRIAHCGRNVRDVCSRIGLQLWRAATHSLRNTE